MIRKKNSLIQDEVSKFTKIASKWWDLNGPFKMLHEINPLRIEYIISIAKKHLKTEIKDLNILDVGCGGGILSIPLARLGANVTGIDAGAENIKEAESKAQENQSLKVNFENILLEEFTNEMKKFDIVICLEVLEHIENPGEFIKLLSTSTKEGGVLIMSTINRNLKSNLLAIGVAEYILGLVPKGTHDSNKFIKPSELEKYGSHSDLRIADLSGMSYSLFKQEWMISKDIDVNFFCTFIKASN